ncbi:hypothetical protein C8R45DRAFT_1089207 [Mycena sanguinolenta]|nr:hypothetical protein C8R45DRAFT_1089207 [Mycena sanguinolenta]
MPQPSFESTAAMASRRVSASSTLHCSASESASHPRRGCLRFPRLRRSGFLPAFDHHYSPLPLFMPPPATVTVQETIQSKAQAVLARECIATSMQAPLREVYGTGSTACAQSDTHEGDIVPDLDGTRLVQQANPQDVIGLRLHSSTEPRHSHLQALAVLAPAPGLLSNSTPRDTFGQQLASLVSLPSGRVGDGEVRGDASWEIGAEHGIARARLMASCANGYGRGERASCRLGPVGKPLFALQSHLPFTPALWLDKFLLPIFSIFYLSLLAATTRSLHHSTRLSTPAAGVAFLRFRGISRSTDRESAIVATISGSTFGLGRMDCLCKPRLRAHHHTANLCRRAQVYTQQHRPHIALDVSHRGTRGWDGGGTKRVKSLLGRTTTTPPPYTAFTLKIFYAHASRVCLRRLLISSDTLRPRFASSSSFEFRPRRSRAAFALSIPGRSNWALR